jgi:hypothetical protein
MELHNQNFRAIIFGLCVLVREFLTSGRKSHEGLSIFFFKIFIFLLYFCFIFFPNYLSTNCVKKIIICLLIVF